MAKRARRKYCNFTYFNRTVNAKIEINQIQTKIEICFEYDSKPMINSGFSKYPIDLKESKGKCNLHYGCCTGRLLGPRLGPPHGPTPAAVIVKSKLKLSSLKSSDDLKRNKMDHTVVSNIRYSSMTL